MIPGQPVLHRETLSLKKKKKSIFQVSNLPAVWEMSPAVNCSVIEVLLLFCFPVF